MEETYLMEHIKEQACYVSTNLTADLVTSRMRQSPTRREYVLPDGVNSTTGYLRSPVDPAPGSSRHTSAHPASNEQASDKTKLYHYSCIQLLTLCLHHLDTMQPFRNAGCSGF